MFTITFTFAKFIFILKAFITNVIMRIFIFTTNTFTNTIASTIWKGAFDLNFMTFFKAAFFKTTNKIFN